MENQYICDKTHGSSCCSSIRMGEMKLILGNPGPPNGWYAPSESPDNLPDAPGPWGWEVAPEAASAPRSRS